MDKKNADNCLGVRDRQAPSAPPSSAPRATSSTTDSVRGVNSHVKTLTGKEEEYVAATPLDPYSACASFRWDVVDFEEGFAVRDYYWYEPDRPGSDVDDYTMRAAYPKIGDDEWRQLFHRAFRRGGAAEAQIALEDYDELRKNQENSS
jgi:hypothetical protein